ncbi:hypothetical protein ACFYPK_00090 [Streptomyces halstedii]|uniref:hypothetical protein n=1 Tax=Streptomyces TaxID=1883 RepID=UPI0004A97231|nr:hypothetical protein [Streptomyces sp. NTK 937]KDQ68557.1 hypothetical protein DT87_15590 [Streptomyces sp. NTK 937]WSX36947.1 hypothetical protein OG291_15345 [Streptomyces halstedii]
MSTPLRPGHVPSTAPSPLRASVISGIFGGVAGAVMSALVNYLAIGMPDSPGINALNHGVSGLVSGFIAGFIGLLIHIRKTSATVAAAPTAPESAAGTEAEASRSA